MALWHCTAGGTKYGPITQEVLRQWLTEGRVRPSDLVWTEGMADWQPASSVADLVAGIPFATSAAPAQGAWPAGGAAPSAAGPTAESAPGAPPAAAPAPIYPQQAYYPAALPNAPGAVGSLVCGIVGVALWCAGLILGIVAIVQAKKAREHIALNPGRYGGAGMATAGYVLGIIGIVWGAFGLLYMIFFFAVWGTAMSHGFR